MVQLVEKCCSLPKLSIDPWAERKLPKKCHPLGITDSSLHLWGWRQALRYSHIKVTPGARRFQAMNPVCTDGCLHPPAGGEHSSH